MVCLTVAILTRGGKTLLSRQFVPMTRIRVEGLLGSFPKLLGSSSQHTFIETDEVRYVYQGSEDLYVLMVTNKQSNIMEDLETLRLICKLIPEYAGANTEEAILKNLFELVFAIDEVISIGYREHVTLQQIKSFTTMDSNEEKLQKIIMESKISEAREEARRKAESIDRQKAEMRKLYNQNSMGGGGDTSGYGNSFSDDNSGGGFSYDDNDYDRDNRRGGGRENDRDDNRERDYNRDNNSSSSSSIDSSSSSSSSSNNKRSNIISKKSKGKVKGMSLGKSKKKDDFFTQLHKEEKMEVYVNPNTRPSNGDDSGISSIQHGSHQQQQQAPASYENVQITVEEKVSVDLEKEGDLKKMEVKGKMQLIIYDPDDSRIIISTNGPLNKSSGFRVRMHPNINKSLWNKDGKLGLNDADVGFPVGANNKIIFFQWRKVVKDEAEIPFSLNFWPSDEDGQTVCSVEFSLENQDLVLDNVDIAIPCPGGNPDIRSCDGNTYYDSNSQMLHWTVSQMSADNDSGSLEFAVEECDESSFFPIRCGFVSKTLYSGLEVTGVHRVEDGTDVNYVADVSMSPEKFLIHGDE